MITLVLICYAIYTAVSGVARIFCGEVLLTNKRNFLILYRVVGAKCAYCTNHECDRITHGRPYINSVLAYSHIKLDIGFI